MIAFTYFVMLLRQHFITYAGVIHTPMQTNGLFAIAMTAETGSPMTAAEGGGLGGHLESIAAALRNFLTTTADSMIGAGWTPGRQVRATTLGDQAAAA